MIDAPDPATPPVKPPVTVGAPHVYVVPAGTMLPPPFAGVTVNVAPLQIVDAWFVIDGTGLTVTSTVNIEPVHPLAVGVIV